MNDNRRHLLSNSIEDDNDNMKTLLFTGATVNMTSSIRSISNNWGAWYTNYDVDESSFNISKASFPLSGSKTALSFSGNIYYPKFNMEDYDGFDVNKGLLGFIDKYRFASNGRINPNIDVTPGSAATEQGTNSVSKNLAFYSSIKLYQYESNIGTTVLYNGPAVLYVFSDSTSYKLILAFAPDGSIYTTFDDSGRLALAATSYENDEDDNYVYAGYLSPYYGICYAAISYVDTSVVGGYRFYYLPWRGYKIK